jgi:transposase
MSRRPRVLRSQRKIIGSFDVVNPNAAGIDAGSEQHWVSVPEDRSDQPVRPFGTFTEDLYELADWLAACGITTAAIEATGVYWIPLFEILEARGLQPQLIDSRSIGRRNKKTDVLDCQWIRQLHTHGLLDAAFRPDAMILPLRAYLRQRRMLIERASDHIRHMQKALDLMNVKLHLVLSDLTGATGRRIIHAILDGQRDPEQLAAMRDPSCKHSAATIAKALMGNYREEHLFALRQAVELFETYQNKLIDCDQQIARLLDTFEKKADRSELSKPRPSTRRKNQLRFDARSILYEMAGVDLTAIDGLDASSVLTILSETGTDMGHWTSDGHFTAWLALCPNKPRSGKRPFVKKAPVIHPNRAAQAFRLAAQTLERVQCALGAFFRRIQSRHGRAVAIKATARKLAVIFYSMLKTRTPYHDPGVSYYEHRYRERLLNSLKKKAVTLGYHLIPIQEVH